MQEQKPRKYSAEFIEKLNRAHELAEQLRKQLENWGEAMEKARERQLPEIGPNPESTEFFRKLHENKEGFTAEAAHKAFAGVKRRAPEKTIADITLNDEWQKRMQEALSQKSILIPNGLSRDEVREFILKNCD